MKQIVRFFECLLPNSQCNLECEYCYLIQQERRKMKNIELDYSVSHILKALTQERLGGICYFSLCGTGETLLQKEIVELTKGLLQAGHYVNITTNGTVTKRFEELMEMDSQLLSKLNFSFSFHYCELVEKKMIDTFFNNIRLVRKHGCSIVVQINLYDGYVPYIEEIKRLCLENTGAFPQVAVTRKQINNSQKSEYCLHTMLDQDKYVELGKQFHSPLFDFTMKNFNVHRTEFCYAGDWSFILDMKTGDLKACYHGGIRQNIFENPLKPIKVQAVGNCCGNRYCINSSHFLSLGVIPSIKTPTYAALRNRNEADWYNDEFKVVLNKQFREYKKEYGFWKKLYVNIIGSVRLFKSRVVSKLRWVMVELKNP